MWHPYTSAYCMRSSSVVPRPISETCANGFDKDQCFTPLIFPTVWFIFFANAMPACWIFTNFPSRIQHINAIYFEYLCNTCIKCQFEISAGGLFFCGDPYIVSTHQDFLANFWSTPIYFSSSLPRYRSDVFPFLIRKSCLQGFYFWATFKDPGGFMICWGLNILFWWAIEVWKFLLVEFFYHISSFMPVPEYVKRSRNHTKHNRQQNLNPN